MKKLNIILDIDDVVADWIPAFCERYKCPLPSTWVNPSITMERLNELKKDKENVEIQESLLNMLFNELDSDAILLEYDDWEDIVYNESDMFDNWLNHYEMAVDMNSYKLYSSYELEELDLDIDYQDLD